MRKEYPRAFDEAYEHLIDTFSEAVGKEHAAAALIDMLQCIKYDKEKDALYLKPGTWYYEQAILTGAPTVCSFKDIRESKEVAV